MDDGNDAVCAVELVSEVSEDPSEPYELEDDEDSVGMVSGVEPAALELEVEGVITLDDDPE